MGYQGSVAASTHKKEKTAQSESRKVRSEPAAKSSGSSKTSSKASGSSKANAGKQSALADKASGKASGKSSGKGAQGSAKETKTAKKSSMRAEQKEVSSRSDERSTSVASRAVCKTVRVKTKKGTQSKRVCNAPAEPLLTSNVDGSALTKPAPEGKEPEIKARTVPDRAYAVDGETFFFQGRKFRIAGLKGEAGSEMSKQRLQRALDSGSLMVDPVSVDGQGVATASVRVNGRSLEDLLAQP